MRHRGAPWASAASLSLALRCRRRVRLRVGLLRGPFGLPDLGARAIQEVLEQLGVLYGHAAFRAFGPELTRTCRGRPLPALPRRSRPARRFLLVVRHAGNLCTDINARGGP